MTYRAAIVGRAATTALGADLEATWAALEAGRSALAPWPSRVGWEPGVPWCARLPDGGEGAEQDPTQRVLGRHGAWLDRTARAAHEQAGWRALPREQVGLYVALGMVDATPEDLAQAVLASRAPAGAFELERFFAGGFRAMHPLWPLSMLGNVAAGQVAIDLDLRGDNCVLASDASAGLRALGEALRALATGAVRAALVGGASEPVTEATLVRRRLAGSLGLGDDAPPAEGVCPGEGAAMLALEDPASAQARGAAVLGWVRGHGQACAAAQGGEARRDALLRAADLALASAGIEPRRIDLLINDAPLKPGMGGTTLARGGPPDTPRSVLDRLVAAGARPTLVFPTAALGHLLGANAPLAVALALASFAAGRPPRALCLTVQVALDAGTAVRPPQRALVTGIGEDGLAGALVVEAPACAS